MALPAVTTYADGDPGFAALMGKMQTYLHKLDLSVQAGNTELIGFYVHELEEAVEEVTEGIDTYDGFPVGELTGAVMTPAIEALEDAVDDSAAVDNAMNSLVDACNSCHDATDHGFISIKRAESNPFNQTFE